MDLLSAAVSGGGSPLLSLLCARDKALKSTVQVAGQAHAEASQAMELGVSYFERLVPEVVEFRTAKQVLRKPGTAGGRK